MSDDTPIADEDIAAGDPRYDGFRVTEVWAFIAVDPADNQEGIAAFRDPITQAWMPLVAADERRLESLRPMAQRLANMSGVTILLKHFTNVEVVETIEPRAKGRRP